MASEAKGFGETRQAKYRTRAAGLHIGVIVAPSRCGSSCPASTKHTGGEVAQEELLAETLSWHTLGGG